MDVNSSTNREEALRCRDVVIKTLRSAQYWQGTIRTQQIRNSVHQFERYLRLSNETRSAQDVAFELRSEIADTFVFEEFLRLLRDERQPSHQDSSNLNPNIQDNPQLWLKLKAIYNFIKFKICTLEGIVFNMLPLKIQNLILDSYRKPLFALYSINILLLLIRIYFFKWRPIFGDTTKDDDPNNQFGDYSYSPYIHIYENNYSPTLIDYVYEVLSFFINLFTSIIPLVLPLITLNWINGQSVHRHQRI
ncbi:hypothetical protein cand_036050 [Cryptosporidium andersoni]|uniref:Uncharacterized protein n=1 Tax=Cryptosporidium andersoni TaxID=117008 RepID=A0A1J4MV82_9CRYT|nr:hypothetical protein cand_036050 [Cryptosporidium andersoni]